MILINGEKMNPNDIPNLKKRAVFQLMGTYTRQEYDKKDRRYRTINAQSFSFPTSYVMYDERRGESVEVRYAVTETPSVSMDGKQFKKYQPHKIIFEKNGMKIVDPKDKDLYFFMMNCPKLDKGDGKGTPSFYLVSPEKNATNNRNKQLMEYTALSMLIGPTKKSMYEQRRLVEALGLSVDVEQMSDDMINTALTTEAKADPEGFIAKSQSAEINIKVLLAGARKSNFINYNVANKKWTWGIAISGSAARDIVVVPVSRDPEEYFIEWLLRTDNSGVLNEIQILVKGSEEKRAKLVEIKEKLDKAENKEAVLPVNSGSFIDESILNSTSTNTTLPNSSQLISSSNSKITPELKERAKAAGMILQGIGTMRYETFIEKLKKAEDKKAKQIAV